MNNEEYVTLEQAKHLHRLGFSELCFGAYSMNNIGTYDLLVSAVPTMNFPDATKQYAAPSQAMALRWIREQRNIYVFIKPFTTDDMKIVFNALICRRRVAKSSDTEKEIEIMPGVMQIDGFTTMEEAYSAALDEVLEILKPKKQ